MGTSLGRSPDAAFKAPMKSALMLAIGRLDVLVHRGSVEYADALRKESASLARHPLARKVLEAIALAVMEAE